MGIARLLYLNSFTNSIADSEASDEIGYGITANKAIKDQLLRLGYEIYEIPNQSATNIKRVSDNERRKAKLQWIQECYQQILSLDLTNYDAICFFHIFHQFPCEIKRILLDLGLSRIKLLGYTLGSHWDPTDIYRFIAHPGMHLVDLANLYCLDKIFAVTDYFRDVLITSLKQFNNDLANEINRKITVVGLPINATYIDRFRTVKTQNEVIIVFNHAPIESKRPDVLFRIIEPFLDEYHHLRLVVTRRFYPHSPGAQLLNRLAEKFGDRIILGNTLPLHQYFDILWKANLQISTSEHESLGISTLEAMYTNNCCLLPNRCSYPEVVGPVYEALYSSESELIDKLHHFITDADHRISVASKLRERAELYVPEVVAYKIHLSIQDALS